MISNYHSEILPGISQGLGQPSQSGVRAMHMIGPHGSGKSNTVVPEVWQRMQEMKPGAKGSYVLLTAFQAELQQSTWERYQYHISVKERSNLFSPSPTGEQQGQVASGQPETLMLTHYMQFESDLRKALEGTESLVPLSCPFLLIIDLETVPTVRGEVMLGLLIEYLSRVMQLEQQLDFTVVTLATFRADWICDAFERFLHMPPPIFLIWKDFEPGCPVQKRCLGDLQDFDRVREQIINTLVEAVRRDSARIKAAKEKSENVIGDLTSVLLFMDRSNANELIIDPLIRRLDTADAPQIYVLDDTTRLSSELVEHIFQSNMSPRIFCVHHSFPYIMQQSFTHVISIDYKTARVFDPRSSQFLETTVELSDAEIRRQDAWVYLSPVPAVPEFNGDTDRWWALYTAENTRPEVSFESLSGDLLYLAHEIASQWSGAALEDVPIPVLHQIETARLLEMFRRLRALGCVSRTPSTSRWQLTSFGSIVDMYLYSSCNETNRSYHVAVLLAFIMEGSMRNRFSIRVIRVLIRIAAIIACDLHSLVSLTPSEGANAFSAEGQARLLEAAEEDSAGIGKQQIRNGTIWAALGLWQARKAAGDVLPHRSGTIYRARNAIAMDTRLLLDVDKVVTLMEKSVLESSQPRQDEIKDTQLNAEELQLVNQVLLATYMHQQVYVPFDGRLPIDLVSVQPVDLDTAESQTLTFDWRLRREQGVHFGEGGFAAVYLTATRQDGQLAPSDLTYIPNATFRWLKDRLGCQRLASVLNTTYPVETPSFDDLEEEE